MIILQGQFSPVRCMHNGLTLGLMETESFHTHKACCRTKHSIWYSLIPFYTVSPWICFYMIYIAAHLLYLQPFDGTGQLDLTRPVLTAPQRNPEWTTYPDHIEVSSTGVD